MAERFRALHGRIGFWLRSFDDSGEGTLDGVLDTLLNPEFGNVGSRGTLCLKVADGTRYWSGTHSLADIVGLRTACHARGVAFLPVVLPRGPEAGRGNALEQATMHAGIAEVCGCLMVDVEPYCHDDQTDVLTESGWRRFADVLEGEQVATVNTERGSLEYQLPLAVIAQPYVGDMVHFEGQHGIDIMVTPNHRMLVRGHRQSTWKFVRADQMPSRCDVPACATTWDGDTPDAYVVPDVAHDPSGQQRQIHRTSKGSRVDPELWAEFIGYVVSEGSIQERAGPPYLVAITQHDGTDADRIQACLDRLPFRFGRNQTDSTRPKKIQWRCYSKALWTYVREHVGVGARNKRIPDDLMRASRSVLQRLFDALVLGDGTRPTHTGRTEYATLSPLLADQVQEIAFKLGYRAHIAGPHASGMYRVSVCPKRSTAMVMRQRRVPYDGMVYCFTTPNGTLVTRRRGKLVVSGNSGFWATQHHLIPMYTEALRRGSGDAFLINQPDPRQFGLTAAKVIETASDFDAVAGQHYVGWDEVGWTDVSREVASVQALAAHFSESYPTLYGLGRVDLALRFWERVRELPLVEGVNIFAFGAMNAGQLFAFGQMSRPAVEPDPLPGGPSPEPRPGPLPPPEPEAETIPPRIALRMGLGWGGAAIAQRMLDLDVPDAEAFGFVRGTALGLIDSIDAAGGNT